MNGGSIWANWLGCFPNIERLLLDEREAGEEHSRRERLAKMGGQYYCRECQSVYLNAHARRRWDCGACAKFNKTLGESK